MGRENKQTGKTILQLRRMQFHILFAFVGIILAVTLILSLVILQRSEDAIQKKVTTLIESNTHQQVLNVNAYLEQVEKISSLLFSDEIYYGFDATYNNIEEFDKIQKENAIEERIEDLGVMENFSDFGIIYSDNSTLGWISNSTYDIFSEDNMYGTFASKISNERTNSGWCIGFKGNYDRMYYVRQLNPNAILIAAFYTQEFSSVFEYPDELSAMTIRLIDQDNNILFSSNADEIGSPLNNSLQTLIDGRNNISFSTDDYFITTASCENDWQLVCEFPTDIIMQELQELRMFTYIFSCVMVILVILISVIILRKISQPVGGMVSDLEERAELDQLTGLINKMSFQNIVTERTENPDNQAYSAFVILDLDNFKKINDNLGHAYGDEILTRLSGMIKRIYGDHVFKGRLGGDEFALFTQYDSISTQDIKKRVDTYMDILLANFSDEFLKEHQQYGLSISAGYIIADAQSSSFEALYKKADAALYISKRNGKNQVTMYTQDMKGADHEA
jgi:diguanylate cyclase (GGDEF)-like protein